MILEITFFLVIHACFQNVRIIRVYIVAGDFGMLFNCGANIPICSRLVFGPPPRLPTSFTFSNICKWTRSAAHFVHNGFQLFFCRPVFGLLENITQCFYWFKSRLDVFARFRIRRIRSDTPFTYGIDAYAFGFSRAFGCVFTPN